MDLEKQKYTVYGNCQARILPSVLNSSIAFREKFEYIDLPAVHRMDASQLEYFIKQVVPEIDVFIYQPISSSFSADEKYSTDYILKNLKSSCVPISFLLVFLEDTILN